MSPLARRGSIAGALAVALAGLSVFLFYQTRDPLMLVFGLRLAVFAAAVILFLPPLLRLLSGPRERTP